MNNKVDYQRKLDQVREAFGYDFMALALVESEEYHYVIKWKYASGNLNDRFRRIVLQSGKGIAGMVFKTGKPLLIPSVHQQLESESLFNYPIVQSEKLRSLGAVPLWNDARVAGVLLGGFRDEEHRVTDEMLKVMADDARTGFGDFDGKELMAN